MKAKILTGFNAILAFLLGLFGFTGCEPMQKYGPATEYGCPYATFEASGKVTNEKSQPLENIRVRIHPQWDQYGYQEDYDKIYTNANGEYSLNMSYIFPVDSVDIILDDTTGVYQSDSVRVEVEYDKSKVDSSDHWNEGTASVHKDFRLKKK